MLNPQFTEDTPLPFPGSVGYCRGTAAKVRVLRRDPDGTCFVKLLDDGPAVSLNRRASGNTRLDEGDLYETVELAMFCGKPPKPRSTRRSRK